MTTQHILAVSLTVFAAMRNAGLALHAEAAPEPTQPAIAVTIAIDKDRVEKYHAHEKDKIREQLIARQSIGRLGPPEDVASPVGYLCSEEAGFIDGAVVSIDGGWTAA